MNQDLLRELIDEIKAFREENQIGTVQAVANTGRMSKLMDRWDDGGLKVRADETLPTKVVA